MDKLEMNNLICNLCHKDFLIINDLIHHYKHIHSPCTLFKCNVCNRKFTHIESFRYHLKHCTSDINSIHGVEFNKY